MEDEEPDEYYLNHTAAIDIIRNLIMEIPWYRFYDTVKTVAEMLITNSADDTFTWANPKNES